MTRQTHRSPGRLPDRALCFSFAGVWLAFLLLVGLPAVAGATPTSMDGTAPARGIPTPRFHVESIAVEGTRRASPAVIVSESLLEEGRSYTEAELREARYRVNRLPFVLETGFSFDKGSERGKLRLLITVEEVRSVYLGSDLIYNAYGGSLEASPLDEGLSDTLSAGMRFFAGQGVFFAGLADRENLQVGYTRYRLLDRPMLLRFAFTRESCCSVRLHELGLDPAVGSWTAASDSDQLELTLGLPLGGNHSLRLDASHLETDSAVRRSLGASSASAVDATDMEQQEIEFSWVYDSTDDPIFPTRGDAMTAGIGLRRLEGDLSRPALAGGLGGEPSLEALAAMSSRLVGLSLFGTRHWPLSARQTVSLSLKILISRSVVENVPVTTESGDTRLMSGDVDALEADLGVRYSLSVWGPSKTSRWGELRWETVAGLIYLEASPVYDPLHDPLWGMSASTTLALRNTWGVFRIGFSILDFNGEL